VQTAADSGRRLTLGAGELEGVEEVVSLLEVGANGVELVDEILDADNAKLAERVLHMHGGDICLLFCARARVAEAAQVQVTRRREARRPKSCAPLRERVWHMQVLFTSSA
jgi:hypothetical protein